jgi:hypothetical protein
MRQQQGPSAETLVELTTLSPRVFCEVKDVVVVSSFEFLSYKKAMKQTKGWLHDLALRGKGHLTKEETKIGNDVLSLIRDDFTLPAHQHSPGGKREHNAPASKVPADSNGKGNRQ